MKAAMIGASRVVPKSTGAAIRIGPARSFWRCGNRTVGGLQIGEDGLDPLEIGLTGFCQFNMAGGALQQGRA